MVIGLWQPIHVLFIQVTIEYARFALFCHQGAAAAGGANSKKKKGGEEEDTGPALVANNQKEHRMKDEKALKVSRLTIVLIVANSANTK